MSKSPITQYQGRLRRELELGRATEQTHRPAFEELIESFDSELNATNEPTHVECGAPDLLISRRTRHGPRIIGYIETKDIGRSLGEIERSEQLQRYRRSLDNLILTDYLEFRWYVGGDLRKTVCFADVRRDSKVVLRKGGAEELTGLLTAFLEHELEPIFRPRDLALRMARLTHMIRDIIIEAFDGDRASDTLKGLRQAFAQALIPDLEEPEKAAEFADMFSQTLAYGLFAARCNHTGGPGTFRRLGAAAEIPKTNPFLRTLFDMITGVALDEEPFVGIVDDLSQLLDDTNIEAVLHDFGKRRRKEDPVVHFYESFLAAYDPKLRQARGVYYTPEPVVSYIVRSVDHLLKTRFNCPNGLADTATVEYSKEGAADGATSRAPKVLILDPACGTGTFLYAVVDHIREEFMRQSNAGMWSGYVREHLLPRLFGFELLMAPYAVAHFKLGMQLAAQDMTPAQRKTWAYDFAGDERLGIFLTNTLEEAEKKAEDLFGPLRVITQEANAAARIKRELPIMVVMGNPPYSGHSANKNPWIDGLVKGRLPGKPRVTGYYEVDGKPLGEKNPKWLQDDYVKFIRFGQWRIEQTGAGILAFITNHGYLDNPTFRGMRQQLMSTFDEIYVLDLHGNTKKKERCPDGSKDENVFDIQQGTAICLMAKYP